MKSEEEIAKRRSAYTLHEPFQEFIAPGVFRKCSGSIALTYSTESLLGSELDDSVARAFGLTDCENAALVRDVRDAIAYQSDSLVDQADTEAQDDDDTEADLLIDNSPKAAYLAAISYLMGVAFGRWDVRVVLGTKALPQLGTSNDPIPRFPPGALTRD
ncbi:MAG TPA: hypothetical protein VNH18_34320, partial [Bryobacteraceae bacterium]|nr:hypothetical protein [Bryobacteraceae bacterium]